ncbi:MAG: hypothetical protein J6W60_04750, partial [Treponema sp.]|nr:hypothetical protein [Treponema sp.]
LKRCATINPECSTAEKFSWQKTYSANSKESKMYEQRFKRCKHKKWREIQIQTNYGNLIYRGGKTGRCDMCNTLTDTQLKGFGWRCYDCWTWRAHRLRNKHNL